MSEDKTIVADPGNLTILQPPKRKRACLVQYSGAKLGKRYPLVDAETTVGRVPPAQVVIAEASISRSHATLHQTDKGVEVEDLGSTNGTFVNDAKTQGRATLKDGDIIRLGTILLKFFAHDNVESIMHDKIYRMATIDAGTQIFNKAYLFDALESEFKFSKAYGREMCLLIYDLDFFKKVNDTYGHNAGDFVLKESATLVKSLVRKEDIFGRFGGEEFVIILPNTEAKVAYELAERVRLGVMNHVFIIDYDSTEGKKRVQHKQTISVGVTQLSKDIRTPEELLESADKKLYNSKQSGRNRVTI